MLTAVMSRISFPNASPVRTQAAVIMICVRIRLERQVLIPVDPTSEICFPPYNRYRPSE